MAEPLPRDTDPSGDDARASGPQLTTRPVSPWAGLVAELTGGRWRVRLVRQLLVPMIIGLVPLLWVLDASHRATLTTLGRDQGIFQYIAWAVGQGDVDYRDVRDVNGPLVHLIHRVMLALGGWDEHRFHVLDVWATGLSFAFTGACIPGLVSRRRPTWAERAAWAFAGGVALLAQYHLFLYWNQAQRESFADWFLLPSLGLQFLRPSSDAQKNGRRIVLVAALSTITWFAKPSFVVFTAMQAAVLLFDDGLRMTAREKIVRFAIGGVLGSAIPMLYLLRYGDVAAWARITFVDVPAIYRFIWAKSAQEIFGEEGPLRTAAAALATSAIVFAFVAVRELPRRVLVVALAPICGLASVIMQHKGFGYHFHPVTATTHIGAMLVAAMLWERFRAAPRRTPLGRHIAVVVAVAYAAHVTTSMQGSPHLKNVWILAGGETPERRATEEYFNTFKTYDFFPWDMRRTAEYLRAKTSETARVQHYGMDPYVLFLARRHSATPYVYAYDLNNDAALEGGWSNRPTDAEAWRIRVARDLHEDDMLERLMAKPPEAFVFVDKSPLVTYQSAWEDFQHSCVKSAEWVAGSYRETATFGELHVWLRNDLPP